MPDTEEKTLFKYSLDSIKLAYKPDGDDWITLFIRSVINLRYEINYKTEKLLCKKEKRRFDKKKVKPGMVEPHAFIMISSLKLFVEEYDKIHKNFNMYKHLEKHLLAKKSELYFSGLNVKFKLGDTDTMIQVVDALCVRFYQEVLYALTEYMCDNDKILDVGIDEAMNSYVFSVSNMSILEKHEYRMYKKFPVRKGFYLRGDEKIQA